MRSIDWKIYILDKEEKNMTGKQEIDTFILNHLFLMMLAVILMILPCHYPKPNIIKSQESTGDKCL